MQSLQRTSMIKGRRVVGFGGEVLEVEVAEVEFAEVVFDEVAGVAEAIGANEAVELPTTGVVELSDEGLPSEVEAVELRIRLPGMSSWVRLARERPSVPSRAWISSMIEMRQYSEVPTVVLLSEPGTDVVAGMAEAAPVGTEALPATVAGPLFAVSVACRRLTATVWLLASPVEATTGVPTGVARAVLVMTGGVVVVLDEDEFPAAVNGSEVLRQATSRTSG